MRTGDDRLAPIAIGCVDEPCRIEDLARRDELVIAGGEQENRLADGGKIHSLPKRQEPSFGQAIFPDVMTTTANLPGIPPPPDAMLFPAFASRNVPR